MEQLRSSVCLKHVTTGGAVLAREHHQSIASLAIGTLHTSSPHAECAKSISLSTGAARSGSLALGQHVEAEQDIPF